MRAPDPEAALRILSGEAPSSDATTDFPAV